MNLEESNEFAKHQKTKNKKRNVILALIIICLVAVIFLVVIISVLKAKDSKTPKLFLNGEKEKLSKTFFITQDEINYVSVKELAAITGYSYIQGEYKTFAKDNNYCYLKSKYEVISFNVDNNKIKKYLINNEKEETKDSKKTGFFVKSENDSMEIFELSNNVIAINDNIYMPMENLEKIFNILIKIDGNSTYIYDISYLYERAGKIIAQLKYPAMSGMFENVRAISDGMIVAKNADGNYGVISDNGEKILDFIYKDIQYIQNTEEFFVYTEEDTVGLLDKDGIQIINPTVYDTLTVFDETNKLYLAGKDGKYGILQVSKKNEEHQVKEIVTVAFDKIGIKSIELFKKYKIKETETPNLLEEKFIVVVEDGKFGLYDLEGNRIIRSIYTSFGFVPNEKDKKRGYDSVLVIPKEYGIHGLIIERDGLYGIFDLEILELVIPCSLTKIYTKTESGDFSYCMQVGEELFDVKEFFADYENGVVEEIVEELKEEETEVLEEQEERVEEEIDSENINQEQITDEELQIKDEEKDELVDKEKEADEQELENNSEEIENEETIEADSQENEESEIEE